MTNPISKPTILIVDDSRVNVMLMKEILSQYHIVTASKGLDAIEQAQTDPIPNLILLDIMMPGIDGYEVCRRLKQNPNTKDIPVVFITAQTEAGYIIKGFDAGAVDYIPKPFKIPELQARVKSQITIKQAKDQNERLRRRIEEMNKQLTDSINYAEKIQLAGFPKKEYLRQVMPEHFILFKPRDIVSGDFYWAHKLGTKLVVVAVDCTGHGVPGAIMSVFGITFLRTIVEVQQETDPALILNKMRKDVIEALQQTEESEVKDGMDMSVVTIDYGTYTLEYAGALISAYLIRDNQMTVLSANRMSVSYNAESSPFTKQTVALEKGDCVYQFSDGFASQFGGKNNKKLKQSGLKKLLVSHAMLPMSEQLDAYQHFFNAWKGPNDQVDDVLLIGMRF
ncbi:MAG: response regulator [Breznakibacter sp.]